MQLSRNCQKGTSTVRNGLQLTEVRRDSQKGILTVRGDFRLFEMGDNSRCAYSCSARTYLYRGGTGRGTNFGTKVHTNGMYVCALYDARIFSFRILKTTSFQTVPKTTLAHTERI